MLDKIMQMAKQQLGGQLQKEANLTENQVGETVTVAQDSLLEGFKNEISGGNILGIMDLFNGKSSISSSNPIIRNITDIFTKKLISKIGLPAQTASIVTGIVVPFIMSKFSDKETGTADDENGLLSKLGLDADDAIIGALGKKGKDLLGNLFN